MADQDFEAAAAELRKALDERLTGYLDQIAVKVHEQVLNAFRDEGYGKIAEAVWAKLIGDERGEFPARDVVTAMSWRVKDIHDQPTAAQ